MSGFLSKSKYLQPRMFEKAYMFRIFALRELDKAKGYDH